MAFARVGSRVSGFLAEAMKHAMYCLRLDGGSA